ncbi:ATP-binding protein [Streptomyces sp. JJ38]|uniref:ATP-binding protein n=1 Tax=Streptomyces sp. JJ38 TaxID=2738128 RepID=UPI001C578B7C|nr:ATP-binding protein [Streptomyces sp. JJ38]MBW1596282.1 ATP-binding protein [Streptomyces sp. JJ38]
MPVDQAAPSTPGRSEQQLLKQRFTARTLPQLRVGVEVCAASAGLTEPRRGDFVLAVDEVLTNAVEHAGGHGTLLLRRVGQELEAQITDAGPGFTADVIPELLPGLDGRANGRGLWLARLTTDRLTIAAADPDAADPGTVVTLAVTLPTPGTSPAVR